MLMLTPEDKPLEHSIVGEPMRLRLIVKPGVLHVLKMNNTIVQLDIFGIRPRRCHAVNMDSGATYELTDEKGCAIDVEIMPDWIEVETTARQQEMCCRRIHRRGTSISVHLNGRSRRIYDSNVTVPRVLQSALRFECSLYLHYKT
jgi:hypothetical protein